MTAQIEMTATVAPVTVGIESLGEPMSVPHVSNTDLLDRLVEVELTRAEAAQVLAYYLPLVVDYSPDGSGRNEYLIARLHCAAVIGMQLDREAFLEAALLAEQYENLRRGRDLQPEFVWWTRDDFHQAISTRIDALLDGAK